MPAVLVFLMVVAFLAFALGAVLILTRVLRGEADRVRAARAVRTPGATNPDR